jgi:hypothetical protein
MKKFETYSLAADIEIGYGHQPVETQHNLTADQVAARKAMIRREAPTGSTVNFQIDKD